MKSREHLPKNTVAATYWCNRCNSAQLHRVDNGLKGPCLRCIERGAIDLQGRLREKAWKYLEPVQGELF